MSTYNRAQLLAVLTIVSVLIGCGSNETTTQKVQATTLGQQLMDLKRALEDGAMTPVEYELKRQEIMDTYSESL